MSENKFSKSRIDMAIVQSHLSIFDEDRSRCLKALGTMKVAEEMYAMLGAVLCEMHNLINEVNEQRLTKINSFTETPPYLHDGQTLHEIKLLLVKAGGEQL